MGFMKRSTRQVAVILTKDIEGTGFTGELLTVKGGFARNYLLPQKLAEVATPKLQAEREKQIAAAAARREQEVVDRQALAEKLTAAPLKLKLKVGPDGQVFGSITANAVAKELKAAHKVDLTAHQLTGLPLKSLGSQTVSAKLGLGVVAQVPLEVSGESAKPAPDKEKTPA